MNVVEPVRQASELCALETESREWWRGAAVYHVYPRSFRDSNGDGVGDLNGIIEGLDYIASLGVDGVWLSPFFTSPMRDFGYDVADHCDVDPVFGTLADFDRLVAKAHGLGLKVIIDQVYSHTSDEHAWFAESRRDGVNPKADWYVWADPKPDGAPPNNWQSVFGGPAWTWDSRRQQYYLHNFLPSQPDLNLHNREVQDAILDTARFWLDRGVDGFRLDALNFSMHDPRLRDNPPAPRDGRKITRPFDLQEHKYNQSHPDIPKFLERVRSVTDEYAGVFTVAEVGGAEPLTEMKAFTAHNRRLNSAYSFDFLYAERLNTPLLRSALSAWPGLGDEGWPSWAFSNHDAPRALSRWASAADLVAASKLYLMLLMALRGNVFIYQGEELGLPQAEVPFERLQDPEAIANWPMTLGRDGARTPLPWAAGEPNAGFTSGAPWLPIDPRHVALSVDIQERDAGSTLRFARILIAARRDSTALKFGGAEFLRAPEPLFALRRAADDEDAICVFNLGDGPPIAHGLATDGYEIVASTGLDESGLHPPAHLPRLSGFIAVRKF